MRFRSYRLVKIHSDASSNDKKWNTAVNFLNQHDIKIKNIAIWKKDCSFFLNNRFINANFSKFFHKRMKRNSAYYIAKLSKFYFFEIRIIRIGHEKDWKCHNIIFYCKLFHLFIKFSFFVIAMELKINLKSIHIIYITVNIYLMFWTKSEISKKLIESNKSVTELAKIYIYKTLKNSQSLNYLQDAYSFIISLIKKICTI